MIWFLIIVGLLIFVPLIVAMIGLSLIVLAMPFLVFFVVWGIVFFLILAFYPGLVLAAIAVAFVAAIVAARAVVKGFKRAVDGPPAKPPISN